MQVPDLTLFQLHETLLLMRQLSNLLLQHIHLLGEGRLLLQLALAAALCAQTVCMHALIAPIGAPIIIAEIVQLHSRALTVHLSLHLPCSDWA